MGGLSASRPRAYLLPDGRGAYLTNSAEYPFVLEVDRTHASYRKIWDKFRRYCLARLNLEDSTFRGYRVLLVTSGWIRGKGLAQLARRFAIRLISGRDRFSPEARAKKLEEYMFPTYLTTLRLLRKRNVSEPIWLEARTQRNGVYCLECFDESQQDC